MRSIDEAYRDVSRWLITPVSVLTMRERTGMLHGVTVGSLSYLSRRPPLLTFCLTQQTRSHAAFLSARLVAASLLATGQEAVAAQLAGPRHLRFAGDWTDCAGLPVVAGAAVQMICEVRSRVKAGDHTVFLVEVLNIHHAVTTAPPLLYWGGAYVGVEMAGGARATGSRADAEDRDDEITYRRVVAPTS